MKKLIMKPSTVVTIILITSFCSLHAQYRPNIYFDPPELEATLGMNDSAVVHTVLHNGSGQDVEFAFPGYYSKGQGGPDEFGYSWIDSEEPGGPDWSWTDISETGILVEGLGDDEMAGPFELPFTFPFYGQEKNHYFISPNGVISFDDQNIPYANEPIPTNSNYIDFIAWFWDDLKIDSSISRVYYKNFEEKTVVQFTKMVHYPGTESFITGQVIMMVNGSILIKYRLVSEDFNKTSATAGIQSWNPGKGLQVVYNETYVHSELAVRFDLNRNFITHVNPATVFLPAGTQETIWITYSSEGFEAGTYEQELKCITNHPEVPYLMLHNVMHVGNTEPAGFKGYVTDAVTGYAINEALVKVGEHQTYTNANGFYELPLEHGSYNVKFQRNGYQTRIVEDTTALPGYSILDVTLEPVDPTYFLVGRVYAADNLLETGFAYCYKMIEEEVVDVYAEMVGPEGWYEFSGLSSAHYILKAEPGPGSEFYGDYLPTYYGDVLHWEEATAIYLTQNTDGAHIHLVPAISAPQGPGSISGTIQNSGRTADVPIILRTSGPGAAMMAMSAADGSYAFNDLALGSYELFAEIPGKSITPMTIVLDAATPSKENIDMMVTGNEIIFMGMEESDVFTTMPHVYPNPVKDKVNIAINLKKTSDIRISLQDLTGRLIISENHALNGTEIISLDISDFPSGIYCLIINAGTESIIEKFVKE